MEKEKNKRKQSLRELRTTGGPFTENTSEFFKGHRKTNKQQCYETTLNKQTPREKKDGETRRERRA